MKTTKNIFAIIVFLLCSHFAVAQQLYINANSFPNASVHLTPSWIKEREDLNTKYLKSLDPDRLLHNFRINAGLLSHAQPLEGWESPGIGLRGHFTGHYLSAISSLVERDKDEVLARNLNYMIDELYKCQQVLGNGYLSAFPETDFDTIETQFGGVWAPYYTYHKVMQGLLDAHLRTGNVKALRMVSDMADYVAFRMDKLDDATIENVLYSVEANPQNEAGAMNEVLYKLYQVSTDTKHLKLAKLFDRDWFVRPLAHNHNILNGLHANTHLVLVNGLAQRYTLTGEDIAGDASRNFWDMLINKHAYANGSSSGPRPNAVTRTSITAEHWGVPGQLSNTMSKEIAESCVSHNTQKLTASLFARTANPIYADVYMNTFYNSVLALQSARTGQCVYHLPLGSPRNKAFLKENDFRCCNGSGIEAFALLNSGIYYHDNSSLWVNLYIPSEVNWKEKNITLTQCGNFPQSSSVAFSVAAKKKTAFNLNLFIPSWAAKTDVYINGEKQMKETSPLSYLSIQREWKNNDKIELVFHSDFHFKAMPDNENVIALFYGPVMLAFETPSEVILKGTTKEILNNLSLVDEHTFHLMNNGREYTLRPLYDIHEESYGVYATIRTY